MNRQNVPDSSYGPPEVFLVRVIPEKIINSSGGHYTDGDDQWPDDGTS